MHSLQTDVHWSEKPLSKMTERDWRIFREDFNISYKGNANTLPLRNWDEAGLPEPIRMVGKTCMSIVRCMLWQCHTLDVCVWPCGALSPESTLRIATGALCGQCWQYLRCVFREGD
jgi:hypothetical protein